MPEIYALALRNDAGRLLIQHPEGCPQNKELLVSSFYNLIKDYKNKFHPYSEITNITSLVDKAIIPKTNLSFLERNPERGIH